MAHNSIPSEEERRLPDFNLMQQVKRRFFAMRNGDLAEQMRQRGASYRINFGLNLPQISDIAKQILTDNPSVSSAEQAALATRLWENRTTRESMLIAPMLYPADIMTRDTAMLWASGSPNAEVSDILCHRLLRRLPCAAEIAQSLAASEVPLHRYTALRLMMNLLATGSLDAATALSAAEKELASPSALTLPVSRQLHDEATFLLDPFDPNQP